MTCFRVVGFLFFKRAGTVIRKVSNLHGGACRGFINSQQLHVFYCSFDLMLLTISPLLQTIMTYLPTDWVKSSLLPCFSRGGGGGGEMRRSWDRKCIKVSGEK